MCTLVVVMGDNWGSGGRESVGIGACLYGSREWGNFGESLDAGTEFTEWRVGE